MNSENDDLDRPEEESWGLVVPFIACHSQGGSYDDDAFVAGFQAGRVDQALQVAATVGADKLGFQVYTNLIKQLELVGMNRGFPTIEASDDADGWTFIEFQAASTTSNPPPDPADTTT